MHAVSAARAPKSYLQLSATQPPASAYDFGITAKRSVCAYVAYDAFARRAQSAPMEFVGIGIAA